MLKRAEIGALSAELRQGLADGLSVPPVAEQIRDRARLAALRDLELLETAPEEEIDRYTRLASRLLDAHVSLVSMVEADRDFLVSERGLRGDWVEARQIPLSHALCNRALASREPLVIADTLELQLTRDGLTPRDQDVLAFAGVPLLLEDGSEIGVFCAIDSEPRAWTAHDLEVLNELASALRHIFQLRGDMARMGLEDQLTCLPNRSLLVAYADEYLKRTEQGETVAVLCAGIDSFNQINQAFGTENADHVLRAIAERLDGAAREHGFFGRLRGDVFVLVAPNIADQGHAFRLARHLRKALSERPLEVGETRVTAAVTVGIAVSRPGSRGADLLSEAANAMRQAKQVHTHLYFAEEDWGRQAAAQLQLREALAGALERGEIGAAYQPIVDLESRSVTAVEALARWTHPELGAIRPDEFIPLAEVTGEIIPIGEWMLEQALGQVRTWRAQGHKGISATVNVSPLQLEEPDFADVVAGKLESEGLKGDALGLEITEGALLETGSVQKQNLIRIKDLGVDVLLDDFGTGYSALSYLQRFPIDTIKIDRAFVNGLTNDRNAAALVQAIIAMARAMDLELVAEGIETPEQSQLLRLLGCRFGQGYFFAKPRAAGEVELGSPRPAGA